MAPKSSTENERTTVVVENGKISVLFRQIAGALARRIVMYSKENDTAVKGEDFGLLSLAQGLTYFSSRTPINVKLNDTVKGNKTIIATY